MSNKTITTKPSNDTELNKLVQSMNNAYGKYFDVEISEKRSEKLRDCVCEGIGYENGAYQQLKKEWNEKNFFHSADNVKIIYPFDSLTTPIIIFEGLARSIQETLSQLHPSKQGEELIKQGKHPLALTTSLAGCFSATPESFGYTNEMVNNRFIRHHIEYSDWLALHLYGITVGYVLLRREASELFAEKAAAIHTRVKKALDYISDSHTPFDNPLDPHLGEEWIEHVKRSDFKSETTSECDNVIHLPNIKTVY